MRPFETALCTAFVLSSACKFGPEQLLVAEPLAQEDGGPAAMGLQRTASSADAGSTQTSAASRKAVGTMANSVSAAAAGGGSVAAASDAGGPVSKSNAPVNTNMNKQPEQQAPASADSQATSSAGSAATSLADGGAATEQPAGAEDPTCDLSGIWSAQQVAVTLALEQPQFANAWGYFEVEQSGANFVIKKSIDCGAEVIGSGTVSLSRATMEANVQHNMQNGRKGTFQLVSGKCALDIGRFWSVRGAEEALFIPNPTRDAIMTMAELAQMKPLPTPRMPEGAIDIEGDGELGAAGQVTGIVAGTRNSVQRDWDHWFTAPGYEITPAMDFTTELTVRIEYESEESVMAPTTGLLTTPSEPTTAWEHRMFMRFLGRNQDDPRAQAIVQNDPVETCYAIQDAMPVRMLQR